MSTHGDIAHDTGALLAYLEQKDLWNPDDCAAYLEVARWTFVNRISKLPTFPKPKVELSRRMRRWARDDVKDWRFSYRGSRRRA